MKKNTKKWLIFSGLKVLELLGVGIYIFFMWLNTLWIRGLEHGYNLPPDKVGMGFNAWLFALIITFFQGLMTWGLVYLVYRWIEKNIEIADVLSESKRKR